MILIDQLAEIQILHSWIHTLINFNDAFHFTNSNNPIPIFGRYGRNFTKTFATQQT